jgi:hypothetical protein
MPTSVESNIAFLRAWQKILTGDSFDLDYHMTWEHFNDPGHMQISKTIYEDMKSLADIDLNGLISCQTQRSFFPTGLPMTAMARTLWKKEHTFEEISDDYFASAFGPEWELARTYLTKLGETFDPVYMRSEKPIVSEEAVERLAKVPQVIDDFVPVIEQSMKLDNPCWAQSWKYLKHHGTICKKLVPALTARAKGEDELATKLCLELIDLVWELQPEIHDAMDVWVYAEQWLRFGKFTLPEKG